MMTRSSGRVSRSSVIGALVVAEVAIIALMGVAITGGSDSAPTWTFHFGRADGGAGLAEGGAHRIFRTGSHPHVIVDIGYADLTLVAGNRSQVDVSVSKDERFGVFRARAVIAARQDGESVRIDTPHGRHWGVGDDRMVTAVVPPETQIDVVDAGNVRVNGLRGATTVKSVGNGSIAVEDYDAPALRVESSGGNVSLLRVAAPRLDVTSDDGRVVGTALRVRDGSIDSGDGNMTLGFASGTDALITAQTADGTIDISGADAAGGSASDRSSRDGASARTVKIGSGNGRLELRAGDGNIHLTNESGV
jgi:hypothetical protein